MRKVVKCERFARIGILELHFRLRTPKSANGTLRVVHRCNSLQPLLDNNFPNFEYWEKIVGINIENQIFGHFRHVQVRQLKSKIDV
jgi:hypothetical protein